MDVSKNRGGPSKWMVYNGKPYEQMDDLGVPLFLEKPSSKINQNHLGSKMVRFELFSKLDRLTQKSGDESYFPGKKLHTRSFHTLN